MQNNQSIPINKENFKLIFSKEFILVIVFSIPAAFTAEHLNIPLAWFLGPMIITSLMSLFGLKLVMPRLVLSIILILLGLETSGTLTVPYAGNDKGMLWWWCVSNAGLALFNMIPLGPLDGRKIKHWSDFVFYFWLIICFSLVWFNATSLSNLIG